MDYQWQIREIRDRIAAANGEIDECGYAPEEKENHQRLTVAAKDLHKCADMLQDVLMRIRPKKR